MATDTPQQDLAATAAAMYREGPRLLRLLQRWRPRICPFDRLVAEVPEGSTVLDVGCGGGLFLGLLHRSGRLRRGTGFDSSGPAIRLARLMAARVAGAGETPALRFEHRAVEEAWPEGPFDVVALVDVMHHVPPAAQRRVLDLAAGRVAAGGRLLYKDMVMRPRWRALANRLHDLLVARQWIHYVPVTAIEGWAADAGLQLASAARIDMLCYGHELRVFTRPGPSPSSDRPPPPRTARPGS